VHDLSPLRSILTTGAPLLAEQFDFVYTAIRPDVNLASMSGGTDIISCSCLGNPWPQVHRGEIQARGLGMAVEVWNDNQQRIQAERGELVCTRAFPWMPLDFGEIRIAVTIVRPTSNDFPMFGISVIWRSRLPATDSRSSAAPTRC